MTHGEKGATALLLMVVTLILIAKGWGEFMSAMGWVHGWGAWAGGGLIFLGGLFNHAAGALRKEL